MDYEIVATLGPASDREEIWSDLLASGATAFRLNTSHLSIEHLLDWIERLEPFLAKNARDCPLVLDLQGSKWRLGDFEPFDLAAGDAIELIYAGSSTLPGVLPVPHFDFFQAARRSSGEIVLNDAKTRLSLESVGEDSLIARAIQGGRFSPRKGITYNQCDFRKESLNEKDLAIVEKTAGLSFIQFAISYLKDANEASFYRTRFGPTAQLIAKLERPTAMKQAVEIARICDALWVCRGDLGAEIGMVAMARAVHAFRQKIPRLTKPAMMAGQVFEHMAFQPAPTRSEICYLYDSLQDGYRGFVLSDETAIGPYPVEACRAAALFRA